MEIISGKIIDKPSTDGGDGLVLCGPDKEYLVDNCVFDFSKTPKSEQDELLSFVEGASGKVENCVFMNGIKALLIGNGDHPALDAGKVVELTNCAFLNIGRRCPEAQDGAIVRMKNCWIHNWGGTFNVRAFGSWAHRGAQIYAENCIFTQSCSPSLKERLSDVGNHIGEVWNDKGGAIFASGFNRAFTAGKDGVAISTRCFRNNRRVLIENCPEYLSTEKAREVISGIQASCLTAKSYLQKSILDLFNEIVG